MALIGAHVSIAKAIYLSVERAKELDLESFQIFTATQKQWLPGTINEENASKFKRMLSECGLPFIVHAGYLPNLANPEEENFQRSIDSLVQEMLRCFSIDAPYLVMHPGSHKGSGFEAGLERISGGLGTILDKLSEIGKAGSPPTILFENTAGGSSAMGATFEHIASLIDASPVRSGICLDTCHAHAAGYDLAKVGGMAETVDIVDSVIGLKKMSAIHLNDCKSALGSGVDRHADIGEGSLGDRPFVYLMNEKRLNVLPMVMETPGGDDSYRRDLAYLRSLRV